MPPPSSTIDHAVRSATADSAVDLLRRADEMVADEYGPGDRYSCAVRHVIRCAAAMAVDLPLRDLVAAREALSQARAAVVAATYAVRVLHDDQKAG